MGIQVQFNGDVRAAKRVDKSIPWATSTGGIPGLHRFPCRPLKLLQPVLND